MATGIELGATSILAFCDTATTHKSIHKLQKKPLWHSHALGILEGSPQTHYCNFQRQTVLCLPGLGTTAGQANGSFTATCGWHHLPGSSA